MTGSPLLVVPDELELLEEEELEELELEEDELDELLAIPEEELELELELAPEELPLSPPQADSMAIELANSVVATTR